MPEARTDPVVARIAALSRAAREISTIAIVAGVLVAVSVFLVLRGSSPRIAPPAMASASTPQPGPTAGVWVHVAGAVVNPGLYVLPSGARIDDAIEAAGGATRRADLSSVNLAAEVSDGQQIVVAGRSTTTSMPAPTSTGAALVDLNVADQVQLETIPGIGPVTATAILSFRTENGPFTALEALLEVDGIGPATLESIRPYVTI